MKNRVCFLVVFVTFLFFTVSANGATTLMQIGRSPFHTPPLASTADLLRMVESQAGDVREGFAKAGQPDLFTPFMEQIARANIEQLDFAKGSTFSWMLYKKKGKVRVMKDVTWGNEKPFSGYRFSIDVEGTRYVFVVPLGCGNIALQETGPIPAPVVAPAPIVAAPVNEVPRCEMTVSAVRAFCGEIITVDASGSADDGDIASMKIAFVDDQGQVVSEEVVDGGTLIADVPMACGTNTLKVTLTDNDGAVSEPSACVQEVQGDSRVRFLADAGYFRQIDPAHHIFGRIGLEYEINEDFSVIGLIGGAPQIEGLDGKSAFLADLLGEYKFSRYFIDLGFGGWITDGNDDLKTENSQLDLIASVGARIFGEPEDFNTSVFFEVRSAPDELGELIDYGRFGLGLRFRF